MTIRYRSTVLLLFLVGLLFQSSHLQQLTQTEEHYFQVGEQIVARATNGRVFSTVEVKQLKQKYFFIHLKLAEDSKNLPVRMYIYNQGNVNPLKVCSEDQIDSCYLSKEQMVENTNILILTDCSEQVYGFTLRTYWSNLQHLKPNSSSKFFFSNQDQSQLYHLELNDTNFYELRIIMKPQTIRSPFDKVKIYGAFGHDTIPSESEYDFKSIHLWQDAEGVFLYGKQVRDKNMNILIVGEIQTIYTLSCEIVEKSHHDLQLGQMVHEYLQPSEEFMYHADFYKKNGKTIQSLEFDQYVLTFSGFSGKLTLGFYLNEERSQSLDIQPFEYLSDAQYIFKKDQIQQKMRKGLYIYVHALQRKSVYSINFYGRNKSTAIKLNENIYEFIETDSKSNVLTYFQVFHWANDTLQGNLEYSIALTNVINQHDLEFRTCESNLIECTDPAKYQKATKVQNANVTTIGTKETFHLSLARSSFQSVNQAESVLTVVIIVKARGQDEKTRGFVALQYRSQNKLYHLRQGKPFESRIKQNQYKTFKFTNQDPFLKQIKIYVSQISGKVSLYSLRQEPTMNNRFGKEETSSVIVFNKELTSKPIYLVVKGSEEAIFSLQVVTVHKSDDLVSALTLTEDLDFKLRIKPQGSQVVEVVPIHDSIYFEYKASGSILACAVDPQTNDCEKDYKPKLSKTGEINYEKFTGRNKLFKLINPSQSDIIQVTVVYHSNDVVHCQQRHVNQLYYEQIKKEQIAEGGFQNNCYTFPIVALKNLALTFSRVDLGELHYAVAICNSLFRSQSEISEESLRIPGDKIQKDCQYENQKTVTLMISAHKREDEKNKLIVPSKIKFLLENSDDKLVTLPDGITYDFDGRATELPIKTFFYDLVNKKNTTVKLLQYEGFGAFTVKIVASGKKQSQIKATNYDFGFSKSDSYFMNPTLTITKQQLEQKKCGDECSLIIKVYSTQEIGAKVHFGIQISQGHIQLQDHKQTDGFLAKNSLQYYSYRTTASKTAGSLLVQVNDLGRKCARIYLSDYEYPDEKNFLVKEEGSTLVYKDVEQDANYYVTVEAVEDCAYTITASSTKLPVTKLERGFRSKLNLKAGEVRFFVVNKLQKRSFRLLSILQYGQTSMYMNYTTSHTLENLMQSSQAIDFKKFEVKSDYSNRLVLHQNNTYLAQDAYYIIAVQAKSDTQGDLFYGDSETSLLIASDTIINDQLTLVDDTFKGNYYGQGNVTLEINVLNGELNVKIDQHQWKDFTEKNKDLDKNYTMSRDKYVTKFEIKKGKENYFLGDPVDLVFTALKPQTVYSFRFLKEESLQEIHPGQPNFVSISSLKPTNITGTLTHGEEIFISVPLEKRDLLGQIQIKAYAEEQAVVIERYYVRNILKVRFPSEGVNDYILQMKAPGESGLSLTVYQNYGLSMLPPDMEVLIEGTSDWVMYPEGSVLLDLFECEDNASILYSKSKADLDSLQSKPLDLIGMPNQPHAIKLLNPGATFIRIHSKKSYFRWLPMDPEKSKGMGYLDYDIGSITYSGSLLKLQVQWQPIFAKRQTVTRVQQANYVLIVGSQPNIVKNAINCENYNDPNLLYYRYNAGSSSSQKISLELSKSQIVSKYASNPNVFVGIVADAQLRNPQEKQEKFEHYRFVYNTQQVPLQIFKEYEVKSQDIWIVALVGAGVILLLALTCWVCVKKVAPIISRLKQGNVMVEENKQEKEFDVIPASSDRNKVNNNLETDEALK